VVDEANGTVEASGREGDGGGDFGDGLEGLGVDEFKVVDFETGEGFLEEMVAGGVEVDGRRLLSVLSEIAGGEEGAANSGGVGAVFGGELSVAGGEGESIGFTNGGVADDFDGDIEIAHHAPDEGELLEVLVSEEGDVGLEEIEEFQDDGEDAIEVTWAGGSAEVSGEERFGDESGVIGGVKVWNLRDEGEIDSFLFAEGEVVFERLGIISEILGAVELDGIDENGDGDRSAGADVPAGGPDELKVSFMQGSHGGNQGEGPGGGLEGLVERGDVREAGDHWSECQARALGQR